jgi:hypothetical protein
MDIRHLVCYAELPVSESCAWRLVVLIN